LVFTANSGIRLIISEHPHKQNIMFKFIRSLFKSNESEWREFQIRVKKEWLAKLGLISVSYKISPVEVLDVAINILFKAIENDYILLGVDPEFDEALTKLAKKLGKNKTDLIIDALNYYENVVTEWENKS
jgi:hypothetical protein